MTVNCAARAGASGLQSLSPFHTLPHNDEDGIEIPAATKQRLRLDAQRLDHHYRTQSIHLAGP